MWSVCSNTAKFVQLTKEGLLETVYKIILVQVVGWKALALLGFFADLNKTEVSET